MNPYEVLGVSKDADAQGVKRAYRKESSRAHPDRNGGDTRAMTLVNVANDILSDPKRRERYDLSGEDLPPTPPLDHQARMQLAMAFQSVLEKPQRLNIPAAAKAFLHERKRGVQTQISGMKGMQDHFRRRALDVEFKGKEGEPNVFADQLACATRNLESQLETSQGMLLALDRALEMLASYVSTVKEQQFQGYGASPLFDLMAGLQR